MNETTPADHGTQTCAVLRRERWRWLVRGACFAGVLAAFWPVGGAWWFSPRVIAASPFVTLASLIAARVVSSLMLVGLVVVAISLVRRRWFCRWVCPTGLCADVAGRLGLRLGRRRPRLPPLGQWIAIVTLAGAVLGYPMLLWLDPLPCSAV